MLHNCDPARLAGWPMPLSHLTGCLRQAGYAMLDVATCGLGADEGDLGEALGRAARWRLPVGGAIAVSGAGAND